MVNQKKSCFGFRSGIFFVSLSDFNFQSMRKIFLIVKLTALLFPLISFSQNKKLVDSLQAELKNFAAHHPHSISSKPSLSDSTKINLLLKLSSSYWTNNHDSAFYYAQQCLDLSEKAGYKKGIGSAYNCMGVINMDKGNDQAALQYLEKALKIREEIKDRKGIASSYNNIALVYYNQRNYTEALKNHFASLELRKEIGDKSGVGDSYNNIGIIYQLQGNYAEALKNHFASLKIQTEVGTKEEIALSYSNIGFVYAEMGNDAEALNNYKHALKLQEEAGDKNNAASSYIGIGEVYRRQGKHTEALKNCLVALKIYTEIGNKNGVADCNFKIGDILIAQGNYAQALKNNLIALAQYRKVNDKDGIAISEITIGNIYKKQNNLREALKHETNGLALAKQLKSKEYIKRAYENLAEIYAGLQNYELAYRDEVLYKLVYDSLFNKENERKLTAMQMKYEFDKREDVAKVERDKNDAVNAGLILKQTVMKNVFIVGFIFIFLLAAILFSRFRIKRKLLGEKEMLLKEVHHRVKNNLQVISSLLELQSAEIADEKAKAAMIEGQNRIRSIALIHHRLYQDENLAAIELGGFINELLPQVAGVFEQANKKVKLQVNINDCYIDIDTMVPLGLIANEIITNAFKYAFEKGSDNRLVIDLQKTGKGNFMITFKDNGKGLPKDFDFSQNKSLGLRLIRKLSKQIGGSATYYFDKGAVFEIKFKDTETRKGE